MTITVVGQGAIGLLWYYYLSSSGAKVNMLCSTNTQSIPSEVTITPFDEAQTKIPLNTTSAEQLSASTVIIFCLKAYDLLSALEMYSPYISGDTSIVLSI